MRPLITADNLLCESMLQRRQGAAWGGGTRTSIILLQLTEYEKISDHQGRIYKRHSFSGTVHKIQLKGALMGIPRDDQKKGSGIFFK